MLKETDLKKRDTQDIRQRLATLRMDLKHTHGEMRRIQEIVKRQEKMQSKQMQLLSLIAKHEAELAKRKTPDEDPAQEPDRLRLEIDERDAQIADLRRQLARRVPVSECAECGDEPHEGACIP